MSRISNIFPFFAPKKPDDAQEDAQGSQGSDAARAIVLRREKSLSSQEKVNATDVAAKIQALKNLLDMLKANGVPLPTGAESLLMQKPETLGKTALADLNKKVDDSKRDAGAMAVQLEARKAVEAMAACVLCGKGANVSPALDFSLDLGALLGIGKPKIAFPALAL